MSSVAQSQYLRVYNQAGTTLHRWQSYYANQALPIAGGGTWIYVPFEASGITSGQTGDEGGVTITLPALPFVADAVHLAIAEGHRWELSIYQFTPGREADVQLAATFTGEITGASSTLTALSIELGTTLSPVGAQIPPRTFTTRLIGKGCRL